MRTKPTICLDFDGVFNNYNGYDEDDLGTPREGIKEFLETLSKDYTIEVCSVRRYTKIMKWLHEHNLLQYVANVTRYKPIAVAYVDDRGITFNGDYDETLKQLKDFKTYWEK